MSEQYHPTDSDLYGDMPVEPECEPHPCVICGAFDYELTKSGRCWACFKAGRVAERKEE